MMAFASDRESQRISLLPLSGYQEHALPRDDESSKAAKYHRHNRSMANEPASAIAEPEIAALDTASSYRDGSPSDRKIIHTRREIVSHPCAVAKECGGVTGAGRNEAPRSARSPDGLNRGGSMEPSQALPIEFGRSGAFPPKMEGRPQLAGHGSDCRTDERCQARMDQA